MAPTVLASDQPAQVREGQAIILWSVGMFCIFGWDYFMNLPKEIKYIWKKQFNVTSGLYVANRYYGLLQFAVCMWLFTAPITNAVSVNSCKDIYLWQPVGALISTLLSQLIMGHRVLALYEKSKMILGVLGVIMAAQFTIHVYTLTLTTPVSTGNPSDVMIPCIATGPLHWLIAFWAIPLVYDTITFVLTLIWSIQHWSNQVQSATLSLLFRDGLIYFAAVFSMNLVNVVLFVTQEGMLQVINLPATLMLNIIMSCRLILNLREPQYPMLLDSDPDFLKGFGHWNTPGKQNNTCEPSAPVTSTGSIAIITTTDTVQTCN